MAITAHRSRGGEWLCSDFFPVCLVTLSCGCRCRNPDQPCPRAGKQAL